jgi:arylsulfatase A
MIIMTPVRTLLAAVACGALLGVVGARPSLAAPASAAQPNLVIILADDLGWTDLGIYGSDLYETPHIDRLARDGMRFTQAYAACTVCSPTRAALLTGQYPARLRVTDWIPGRLPQNPKLRIPDWTKYLPLEAITLAERLKEKGYATASIGKWHLGQEPYYPEKHGFDLNIAGTREGSPVPGGYFAPYGIPTLREGPEGEYLTDRMGEEAVRFIEANRDRRFFLYLPHFAVHTPLQGRADLVKKYERKIREGMRHFHAAYAAMIESMDDSVGRIREALQRAGVADRTVVVFASDNGGHLPATSNAPLRNGKGSAYEGGVRVPFIVYWPGVTRAGAVSDVITTTTDLYPTMLAAAGIREARPDLDGVDLSPVLRGTGTIQREAIYWHYPHYQLYHRHGTTPYGAIRAGDYKLIEFYTDMRVELYNLAQDIGEEHDLASKQPEVVRRLRQQLHAWRAEVKAQMPTRNPNHDPGKPEQLPGRRPDKEAF